VNALVKLNPAPAQRFNDEFFGSGDKAGLIRILNP
jgi:hypothetical protein